MVFFEKNKTGKNTNVRVQEKSLLSGISKRQFFLVVSPPIEDHRILFEQNPVVWKILLASTTKK